MSRKVILDVDPGIDDAMAIVTALRLEKTEVIGIATVYGNVTPQIGVLNTVKVLKSMHRIDVPVILGAKRPLKKGLLPSKIKKLKKLSHGKWGLGNMCVDPSIINRSLKRGKENGIIHTNLLAFIDGVIKDYKDDEISIIATGPLTNIAEAVWYRPEFIHKIEQLLIMGGAYGLGNHTKGNVTNFAEFNFYCDPDAARLVMTWPGLSSKIKVVGLDVTQQPDCGLDREFVNKIRQRTDAKRSPSSELILSLLEFKLIQNTIFHLHDVLAVLLYERPSVFSFARGNIEITLRGKLCGHSEFTDDDMGNLQAATKVNGHQFKNFLYQRLILGEI